MAQSSVWELNLVGRKDYNLILARAGEFILSDPCKFDIPGTNRAIKFKAS